MTRDQCKELFKIYNYEFTTLEGFAKTFSINKHIASRIIRIGECLWKRDCRKKDARN